MIKNESNGKANITSIIYIEPAVTYIYNFYLLYVILDWKYNKKCWTIIFVRLKKMLIWATVKILTPYVDFIQSLFSISECLWTVRIDPMWGQRGSLIMSVAISSNSKFKIQFVLSIDGIYMHFHQIKPIEMNRFELELLNDLIGL